MALMDVLLDEMRDLYSAENQLVKALPKMVKGAGDASLKSQLKNHLEETKNQVQRLRQAFGILGKKPTGQHCSGMEGVVEEGQEALERMRRVQPRTCASSALRCALSIMNWRATPQLSR